MELTVSFIWPPADVKGNDVLSSLKVRSVGPSDSKRLNLRNMVSFVLVRRQVIIQCRAPICETDQ